MFFLFITKPAVSVIVCRIFEPIIYDRDLNIRIRRSRFIYGEGRVLREGTHLVYQVQKSISTRHRGFFIIIISVSILKIKSRYSQTSRLNSLQKHPFSLSKTHITVDYRTIFSYGYLYLLKQSGNHKPEIPCFKGFSLRFMFQILINRCPLV